MGASVPPPTPQRQAPQILNSPLPTESGLSDILVRKPSSSSSSNFAIVIAGLAAGLFILGILNPKVLSELFSVTESARKRSLVKSVRSSKEEIENKIDKAKALAIKFLQQFNYLVSNMRSTANSLAEVNQLQVDVGELKGRLTEVISNCNALCKRIAAEGSESLRSSLSSFSANNSET